MTDQPTPPSELPASPDAGSNALRDRLDLLAETDPLTLRDEALALLHRAETAERERDRQAAEADRLDGLLINERAITADLGRKRDRLTEQLAEAKADADRGWAEAQKWQDDANALGKAWKAAHERAGRLWLAWQSAGQGRRMFRAKTARRDQQIANLQATVRDVTANNDRMRAQLQDLQPLIGNANQIGAQP